MSPMSVTTSACTQDEIWDTAVLTCNVISQVHGYMESASQWWS